MSLRSGVRSPALWFSLIAIVVGTFYALLFSTTYNLPREDDYDAILSFMNTYRLQPTTLQKAQFFAASQHNEYKLYFEHGLVVAQHALTGNLNFTALQIWGDLLMLGVFAVLAANVPVFRSQLLSPASRPPLSPVAALLPVALLTFSLRAHQTLNWAMGALQNVAVLLFALAAIHFLVRPGTRAMAGACVCLVLAIASSGNGFVVLLTGSLRLLERRRVGPMLAWWVTGGLCAWIYAYHYGVGLHHGPAVTVLSSVLTGVAFPFTFIGNAMSYRMLSLLLGCALTATFVVLLGRGLRTAAPFVFHACMFVLVTAVSVTVTRHAGGLAAAVPSRYGLYGQLFLALIYMGALAAGKQTQQPHATRSWIHPLHDRLVLLSTVFAFVLWCPYLRIGGKDLREEQSGIERNFRDWQLGKRSDPVFYPPSEDTGAWKALATRVPSTLLVAERLHTFNPPPPSPPQASGSAAVR